MDEHVGDHDQVVEGLLGEAAVLYAGLDGQFYAPRRVLIDMSGLLLGAHRHCGNQQRARPLVDDKQPVRTPRLVQCPADCFSHRPILNAQQQVNVSDLEEGRTRESLCLGQLIEVLVDAFVRGVEVIWRHHQAGAGSGLFGVFRQLDGLAG